MGKYAQQIKLKRPSFRARLLEGPTGTLDFEHAVMQAVTSNVIDKLDDAASQSILRWLFRNRMMQKPFEGPCDTRYGPWTREMLASEAEENVGQKSAQVWFSETMLNKALHTLCVKQQSVLYVLPSRIPDAVDFSSGRFDTALELSPTIASYFSDRNSMMFKRAGAACLYVRGSRANIKSTPAALVILDETDEMSKKAYALARERLSAQLEGTRALWAISTPSIPDVGINAQFVRSTQEWFTFKCPHCNTYIVLRYPESLVICGDHELDPDVDRSHYICTECKHMLPSYANHEQREEKADMLATGTFQPLYAGRHARGFHVNQMYAATIGAPDLARSYFRGQQELADQQEFHNSKLGEVYIPPGGRIDEQMLKDCRLDYTMEANTLNKPPITMGVDVGKVLNVEIAHWMPRPGVVTTDINEQYMPFVIWAGTVDDFNDLHRLMFLYRPAHTVIDRAPETRAATSFAAQYPGQVSLCRYSEGLQGKTIVESDDKSYVSVDRTSFLDLALGRFKNKSIALPSDLPLDYGLQLQRLIRHYVENKQTGQWVARYSKTGADHYAHSRNYCEIAFRIATITPGSMNITGSVM